MKGSREGEVLSLDRVAVAKNKQKIEKVLQFKKENTMKNKGKWIMQ